MSKKNLFFIVAILLLFVYGWIMKNYDLNIWGILAGTLIYTGVVQFLFNRWIDRV